MKTFLTLALTLVLTAACLVGCGCTNQNMEDTSAPTVLPTNEEIWNSTETTTGYTTEATTTTESTGMMETTGESTTEESTNTTRSINETQVQNHVNDYSNMVQEQMKKDKEAKKNNTESSSSRMMPGSR